MSDGEGGFLALRGGEGGLHVRQRGGLGGLRDRNAGAGGVEQADRLVRQLAGGDVALGEGDGGGHRAVGDPHAVVLFHRRHEAAQHVDRARLVGLVHRDGLEAAGQRRVLFEVLPVFAPCGGGDGAQGAAGERRFEEVGGVSGAGLSAGADEGVRLVDEEDDGGFGALHLVDEGAQALLELALHRGAGLQQADVERQDRHALQRLGDVAGDDLLREAFHHRGLADACLAGEDRVVLPPAHQDVDDLADLVVAADDGVHPARARIRREVCGEAGDGAAVALLATLGGRRIVRQAGAVDGAERVFHRLAPEAAVLAHDVVGG